METPVWQLPRNVSKFKLHQEPGHILLTDEIAEDTVQMFSEKLSAAAAAGQPFIYVYISSPGGCCHACIALINMIKCSPVPVHTVILSQASSAAAVLFSCGVKRYLAPGGSLMIHDVSIGGSFGTTKSADFLVEANQTKKLQRSLFRIMADNIGLDDRDYFIKLIKAKNNVDVYLDGDRMRELNLVTHDGMPFMQARVEVTYSEQVTVAPKRKHKRKKSLDSDVETPTGIKKKERKKKKRTKVEKDQG